MTEKITTVYYKGNPIALYILGVPQGQVETGQAEQELFAVNLPEVLEALGMLEPLDLEQKYTMDEIKEIAENRAKTILRYLIPQKLIAPERFNPFDSFIPVSFRYIICLEGLQPPCIADELLDLHTQVEKIIRRYVGSINSWFLLKQKRLIRVDEEGNKEDYYFAPPTCLAEIIKVCHVDCFKTQMNGGSGRVLYSALYNQESQDFIAESSIAEYLSISQRKLKDALVEIGMLEKQQQKTRNKYVVTNIGAGYCPKSGKTRKWHPSVIKLLENAELLK